MTFTAVELIETKRDGGELSEPAIQWLIQAYATDEVPDYQMAAMAMAIVWRGLSSAELAAWTRAMLRSGDVLDFSDLPMAKVDKHSTGGVGDKISIPLAPLVASCGVAVPMMSGRGLGHTGGTLDKLESIPGFTTQIDKDRFRAILTEHNLVLAGQSKTMVPADRKLYALRDASGTVPSIPLISSSIMSKKLSEGLNGLVLDVKTGSGAFMKNIEDARTLARTMVSIGKANDVATVAVLTSMDQPLGREVGNANEIRESIDVLNGTGPEDVTELTMTLGEEMLRMAGLDSPTGRLEDAIATGAALEKFKQVTRSHGGDPAVIDDPSLLPVAEHEAVVKAPASGFVTKCDALSIGLAATRLGAGREKITDTVDHGVSVTLEAKVGETVTAGEPLATVRFSDRGRWDSQKDRLASAWEISLEQPTMEALIIDRLDG